MKRFFALVAAAAVMLVMPGAQAGPSQGGIASDNVEYVNFFPFEVGTATGARVIGKYMYVTSWKSFSIYDVSDPITPVRMSTIPFGFRFENEDVATNGKIMIFSQELPESSLHVYDVEDKSNPVALTPPRGLTGLGGHTQSCILKCKYLMGSNGKVLNMRNPADPKVVLADWRKATGLQGSVHDVNEFRNGHVITSPISHPAQWLDVTNPVKPKVKALAVNPNPSAFLFHSSQWPRGGKDKFLLMQGEQNFQPQCGANNGPFMTFDASKATKAKTFKHIDTFRVDNGTYSDGSPAVNGLGCSAHWFQEHETFNNGGLLAMGYYEHGTRFLHVNSKGKITERGFFLPHAGSTSAAYWLTKDIVYGVDYTRGIDILRYKGKVK